MAGKKFTCYIYFVYDFLAFAWAALLSSSSKGSPDGPIVGNNRGKGRRGGSSAADEMTTDRVRTTVTMEQGIHR